MRECLGSFEILQTLRWKNYQNSHCIFGTFFVFMMLVNNINWSHNCVWSEITLMMLPIVSVILVGYRISVNQIYMIIFIQNNKAAERI